MFASHCFTMETRERMTTNCRCFGTSCFGFLPHGHAGNTPLFSFLAICFCPKCCYFSFSLPLDPAHSKLLLFHYSVLFFSLNDKFVDLSTPPTMSPWFLYLLTLLHWHLFFHSGSMKMSLCSLVSHLV